MNSLIDILPIEIIGPGLFLALCLVAEVAGRFRRRRALGGETGYAASAAVSLLALLVSFTFSVALNRYDGRRDLVVEEAAAIGMVWQRAKLLREPTESEVKASLGRYIDGRLDYFQRDRQTDRTRPTDAAGRSVRLSLWNVADRLNTAGDQPLTTRALVDALTRMDDAAARRESMAREHIPLLVMDMLAMFTLIVAAILGYTGAVHGHVTRMANWAFFVLVTLAIVLVLDLDRPRTGLITVSQLPMLELEAIVDARRPPAR
ncbi:hypothetical protein [Sandarakinorhabdus sp. DWP1-3-1]|uniref:bestrophin-like domain n=1 Tax=Sandarakinorhabdus sp. DWP1-3-1 TaxID=2804627 RepID=UPI003CE9BEAA